MPSQEHEMVVSMIVAQDLSDQSLEDQRMGYEGLAQMYPLADDVVVEETSANGVPADWVAAPNADPARAVLYLHGGGYCIGSRVSHRELASRLSRAAEAKVLVVDYRLAPENPFPAAVEDATKSYRWLLDQRFDPKRIAIGGDSAGGGLTMAALLSLRDDGVALPAAAILLSPWVDLECTGKTLHSGDIDDPLCRLNGLQEMAERYAPGQRDNPLASPLGGDLKGLPPTLIQVGTREVLLADSTRLAEKLKAAGVSVELEQAPDLVHVWQQIAATSPEAKAAVDKLGKFVRGAT